MNPQKVKLLALGVLLALSVTVQLAYASQPVPSMYADPSNQQSEPASAQDTTAVAPSQYFIAIFSLGPAWQSDKPAHEQLYFKEHSANLRQWREQKKITLGARYSDKGMIILRARDEAEARSWLENDPMVVNGLFRLELHPFAPFYLGCLEKQ